MDFYSSSDIGDSLDELTCPVCLELYKKPITLPCGHSFCHVCINECWESRKENVACFCPSCREVYTQKPKLKVNMIIANLVEKAKKREVGLGVEARDAEHGGVDVKKGVKSGGNESDCALCNRKATKRCVPCEILCCVQHLKLHRHIGHKLVDPGVKIEELRCNEHGKPIQLYCKDDGSLVCLMCMGEQHQDHNVVAVEIAHAELKDVLAAKCPQVSLSMLSVASQLKQVREEENQTERSGRDAEDMLEERRREVCQFVNESVDLMKTHIKKSKIKKLSLLGKQRRKLEQQMESLRQAHSKLQTALLELETNSFLQGCNDLLKRLESVSDFKSVKTTPLTVQDFSKEKKNLDKLIKLNKDFLETMQKELVISTEWSLQHPGMLVFRNNLRILYGRTPSLDPNSAPPWINISQDLRTATLTTTRQPYPEHPDRFDHHPQVLSSDSFSSGRHYWEVDVSSSPWWRIGICLNSMGRKGAGDDSILGMNPESWCLRKYNNKCTACHNNKGTLLSVPANCERFGFLLDCKARELTCFGDSRLLHVFRGNFRNPVKPAFRVHFGSVGFCSF